MKRPVLNAADAPIHSGSSGAHFEYSMAELTEGLGARSIGANVTRVPPGKAAFPLHHHYANEEHFFILSGTAVLRVGGETFEVKPQDYIVNLPGGAETAHQLVNTGTEDLVYLAISTAVRPEVVGYPESGKTGVRAALDQSPATRFLLQDSAKNAVGYWEGEHGEEVARIVGTGQPRT
jgi:uncharacterized cupin superfamily protein